MSSVMYSITKVHPMFVQARKTDRKLNRVALLVSVSDVRMTDLETGQMCFDISIYRSVM